YNPEYDFPPQILEQVSSLGATLWLDIYSLPFTYLEEQQQKDNLIHALKASKAANKHGIKTDQDRNNLVDLLANIETLKDDIFTDMFPHYAGDEPATEEDIEKALLTTRERIKDLYQLTEKSTFFSGK
ncbi:hypothetical protein JNM87_03550, partial [Candidatus Saccharibacteria bacterium]|nr:hypothetical protein [Candidatus Saccharibacteria bacterium]